MHSVNELIDIKSNFEKARFEADLANKSRSEFLANMSHELRTPLNAIIGFSQMMGSEIFGEIGHPKYNDYVENIQKSGLSLLSKINDLLEIANIDSGKMQLDEEVYDIVAIIRSAIESHTHRAFSNHIQLRDYLPVKPIHVKIDRIRILQVLNNVISNAIKYSNKEGLVDIYCEKRKDGGINIVIEDDGNGIPAAHLQNIKDAFDNENGFTSRNRDCVGIGLAISQEIVKLHEGKIEIESEQGKGTRIKLIMPSHRTVKNISPKTNNQNFPEQNYTRIKIAFEEL